MKNSKFSLVVALLTVLLAVADATRLRVGYYEKTCPQAEAIVRETVAGFVVKDPAVAAALLRLHFHDCFVRGCDGSVLLNSTIGNTAEKDASPNLTLDGFHVIDAAKAAIEKVCPGTVSCADILALSARDGVSQKGGPSWAVETGRHDGRISKASEAVADLPSEYANIEGLIANFARKGFNVKDLAILSGAHTIGNAHCSSFSGRLYNFTGKGDRDPSLDQQYALTLKKECKRGDENSIVEMDRGSVLKFDSSYYRGVIRGRGLFASDAALLHSKVTKELVYAYARNTPQFFHDFGVAMIKMGRVGVRTGKKGEIRKHCALVNA
ncbi:peroxidase 27-like [Wolffia australiana]